MEPFSWKLQMTCHCAIFIAFSSFCTILEACKDEHAILIYFGLCDL